MNSKTKMVTLITGASSGLGCELAKKCAKEGHIVFGVARRKDRLNELAQRCPKDSVITLSADISNRRSIESVVHTVLSIAGRIDFLINNAGWGKTARFEETSFEHIENMISVNCTAAVYLTRLVLPEMLKKGGGRIINISSTAGVTTLGHMAVYGATKHFINGFTKNLHRELKGTGVYVSAFMPGAMKTEFSFVSSGKQTGGGESPEKVACAVYRKMVCSRPLMYPTFRAFLTVLFNRVMAFLRIR